MQALYQMEMEATPLAQLLHEFHQHRLGATIEDVTYHPAEEPFFDDVVAGVAARREEIDALIAAKLASGWTLDRLDKPMRQILRAGAYELLGPRGRAHRQRIISEYVDRRPGAFYDKREAGFVTRPARRHRQGLWRDRSCNGAPLATTGRPCNSPNRRLSSDLTKPARGCPMERPCLLS